MPNVSSWGNGLLLLTTVNHISLLGLSTRISIPLLKRSVELHSTIVLLFIDPPRTMSGFSRLDARDSDLTTVGKIFHGRIYAFETIWLITTRVLKLFELSDYLHLVDSLLTLTHNPQCQTFSEIIKTFSNNAASHILYDSTCSRAFYSV